MVRLDVLVAGILADARRAMDERKTGRADIKAARAGKGARGEESARVKGDRLSPRATVRRGANREQRRQASSAPTSRSLE